MSACLYCGQTATKKDQDGFCKKYNCKEKRNSEMKHRWEHRYDHLKPNNIKT